MSRRSLCSSTLHARQVLQFCVHASIIDPRFFRQLVPAIIGHHLLDLQTLGRELGRINPWVECTQNSRPPSHAQKFAGRHMLDAVQGLGILQSSGALEASLACPLGHCLHCSGYLALKFRACHLPVTKVYNQGRVGHNHSWFSRRMPKELHEEPLVEHLTSASCACRECCTILPVLLQTKSSQPQ